MDNSTPAQPNTKFCKHCGAQIPDVAVICTHCGGQAEEIKHAEQPSIVINNANNNANVNNNNNGGGAYGTPKSKWVALLLCLFLGYLGAHKFYDGKAGLGILYILTMGLFGIGILIDFISIPCRPNPYYVGY